MSSLGARAAGSSCQLDQLDLPGLERPTSIDFAASTGHDRPTSIDLGASTYPERPTSIDFGPILHSISVVFRGSIVRATCCAVRCAEPSFLLAGAVLRRVRTHSDNAENRAISSKNRPDDGSRTSSAYKLWHLSMFSIPCATQPRFSSPQHAPGCSRALLLVPGATSGILLVLLGRSGGALRRSRDAPGALLGASGVPGWHHLA